MAAQTIHKSAIYGPAGAAHGRTSTPKLRWPTAEELADSYRRLGVAEKDVEVKVRESLRAQQRTAEVAREFESHFVSMLLRDMKKSVEKNEMFSGGRGEEIFDDMLTVEQAKGITAGRSFGIAAMVEQSFMRQQGARSVSLDSEAVRDLPEAMHRSPLAGQSAEAAASTLASRRDIASPLENVRRAIASAERTQAYGRIASNEAA